MTGIVKTRSPSFSKDKKEIPSNPHSPRSATHLDSEVGLRVQTYRCIDGFSRTEFAQGLGITTQQLQKYEKGTNRIAVSTLIRMAQFLNRNVTDFFLTDKIGFKFNDSVKDSYSHTKSTEDSEIEDEIRGLIRYYSKIKDKSKRDFIMSVIKNFSSNLV